MKKLLGTLLILLFSIGLRAALDPPSMRCVSVDSANGVTISWFPPIGNPIEFVEYQIFESISPTGPFNLLASIPTFATASYNHPGAIVNNFNTHYYFIQTVFNDGTIQNSTSSDTISPMRMNLTLWQQDYAGQLNWNPIHGTAIPSNGGYEIQRRVGVGMWANISGQAYGNESFADSISRCDDTVYYRVRVQDATACFSISTVAKENLVDNTPPNAPEIDSISINNVTGTISISWKPSSSPDVTGYTITRLNPATPLDTVIGRLTNVYVDNETGLDYFNQSLAYEIAAIDSCGNVTPGVREHETMNLSFTRDLCERSITLSWTAYKGWNVVNGYTILMSEAGGPYTLLGTTDQNQRSFVHSGIDATKIYCYIVRANGAGVQLSSSQSDLVCVTFPNLTYPSYQYLNKVSVTEDNNVELSCYVDSSLDLGIVVYYEIKRGLSTDGPFETIDTLILGDDDWLIEYTDSSAYPDMHEYTYRVDAIDNCDQILLRSNYARTLHLKVFPDKYNFSNTLNWTEYTDWLAYGDGVGHYEMFRVLNNETDSEVIYKGARDVFELEDDLGEFQQQGSKICYFVEARERSRNTFGILDTSRSNRVCTSFESDLYIPTAFSPNRDGTNEFFKPITPYINPQNYECKIYDRWGQLVYVIDQNDFKGWSGFDANGNPHPIGAYVYHLRLTTERGSVVDRKGSFTLLR